MASDGQTGVAHLVGIGGIGMSGLARMMVARGWSMSGSDSSPNELTDSLKTLGIRVHKGHDPANLPDGCGIVIRSAAVPDTNPEIAAAVGRKLEILTYAQMLGRLMAEKSGIAVAGCHGKTTTTGMISYILSRAGFEPSFVCGGVIPQLGSNSAPGAGRHFVAEACEFNRSFLQLSPQCAVITNIEEDHLDYYRDIEEIVAAFREFAGRVGEKGIVIGGVDNEHVRDIITHLKGKGESYSIEKEADWQAVKIVVEKGAWRFEVLKYGRSFGEFTLAIPGVHNVSNALAAIAAATWAGVGREIVQLALSEYLGCQRRFQVLGERKGALVIDDYGHHPTEIQATLRAARERFPDKKIWAVFQPHQHSRTRFFMKDFAKSFGDAHLVLLPEIYAARDSEADQKKVSSAELAKLLDANGKAALFLPSFDEVVKFLDDKVDADCVVITIGAGNVGEIARKFLSLS